MSSYSYQNYKLDNHTGGVSCLSYPMTLHILSFIHVSKFNVHNIFIKIGLITYEHKNYMDMGKQTSAAPPKGVPSSMRDSPSLKSDQTRLI